jgi:hypothetical protein
MTILRSGDDRSYLNLNGRSVRLAGCISWTMAAREQTSQEVSTHDYQSIRKHLSTFKALVFTTSLPLYNDALGIQCWNGRGSAFYLYGYVAR